MLPHEPYLDRIIVAAMPCILLEGADARRFAQAQFSGDLHRLAPDHWQWSAWLDARGRIRALMWLADLGAGRLLAMLRGGDPEPLRAALQRYLFRAQTTLTLPHFAGRWGAARALGQIATADTTLTIGLGDRSLRLEPAVASSILDPDAANAWCLADIRHGWPQLPANVPPLLPPALGLERLEAVSFTKGCYPGQEIAARLHYRGGHKLCLQHVRGKAPLPSGPIPRGGQPALGYVLSSARALDGFEALIVAPRHLSLRIKILDNSYDVVSRFDA